MANVGITHPYVRYAFPENRITYPPSDLLDRLMELDEPGKTLIFKDQPQKEFFVAVLEERVVPGVKDKDFLDAFADATQPQQQPALARLLLAGVGRRLPEEAAAPVAREAGAIDEQTGKLVLNTTKAAQHGAGRAGTEPPGRQRRRRRFRVVR